MLSPSRVKIAMRPHGNLHQRVAGRAFAGRGRSLAAQAQDLPVLDACGNRHIQGSPLRQGDRPGRAIDRVEKFDLKLVVQVGARPPPRLFGGAAQKLGEHVVALREIAVSAVTLVGMAGFARVVAIVAGVRRRLLRSRGVDLAGVEPSPLVRIREQIVGGGDLLELLLRPLVAGVEVRVKLLGELPVGLADIVGSRGLGDAKNLVRVSHGLIR